MDSADVYPWSANARKLQRWFRALVILFASWIISLFLPLPDSLMAVMMLCLPGWVIAAIACDIYAYRVQAVLQQLRFSATEPWVIALGAVLISPVITAIIASIMIGSSLKRITRGLQDGSLVMPSASEISHLTHGS